MAKSMKPRKVKAPTKVGAPQQKFRLNIGTPNQPAEAKHEKRFSSDTALKGAAIEELTKRVSWCKIYNNAGIPALEAAMSQVSNLNLTVPSREPKVVDAAYDDYSGMTIRLVLWHDH